MFNKIIASAAVLLAVNVSAADTVCDPEAIKKRLPGVDASTVVNAPVDGLCEIAIGPQIVYVSPDAAYLVRGDIIELVSNVNLTDKRKNAARARVLNGVNKTDMIVFSPGKNVQHTITVFTDIDCGYCRKLHLEMDDLNSKGIAVQYLFFPRSGPNTPSWQKAQKVWCSDDRNTALTAAKRGENVEAEACDQAPVMDQYQLGQAVGLRGTPAIVTESGDMISGYLPAASLLKRLDSLKSDSLAAVK